MIQAADELESMEHIADRRSRVETADTGGSSDKQNSSTLQAYPLITEQNQENGFGPSESLKQTLPPQPAGAAEGIAQTILLTCTRIAQEG